MEKKKNGQIPKILHQMWFDVKHPDQEQIPEKYQNLGYSLTFKKNHPAWEYEFWNLKRAESLFFNYPELAPYKEYFMQLTPVMKKCDFARHAILYAYGGIYIDLDFKSLKPLDTLIENRQYLYVKEPRYFKLPKNYWIYSGFFGSIPRSQLCLFLLHEISISAPASIPLRKNNRFDVLSHTGPWALRTHFAKYQQITKVADDVLFIPSSYVFRYPYAYQVLLEWLHVSISRYPNQYVETLWLDGTNWEHAGTKLLQI